VCPRLVTTRQYTKSLTVSARFLFMRLLPTSVPLRCIAVCSLLLAGVAAPRSLAAPSAARIAPPDPNQTQLPLPTDPANTTATTLATTLPAPAPTTPVPATPVATIPTTPPPLVAVPLPTVPEAVVPTSAEIVPIVPDPSAVTVSPESSTIPSDSTSTTGPSTIPTETIPGGSTIPQYLPVPGVDPSLDANFDDAIPEEVPLNAQVFSTYGAPAIGTNFAIELAKLTAGQRIQVLEIQKRLADSTGKVTKAQAALEEYINTGRQNGKDLEKLHQLRDNLARSMRQRALRQYTGESAKYLRLVLESKDVNSLRRSTDFVAQAQRRDASLVQSYRQNAKSLEAKQLAFEEVKKSYQFELDEIKKQKESLQKDFDSLSGLLGALQSPVAFEGFVFPVQPPYSYIDTYGADRMNGSKYQHKHQGTDIFAREGTPLVATKRGIVFSIGVAKLGGNRVWLKDTDGTCYYYAHLKAFAAGLYENKIVESGEVLGYVGVTGNAVGTPPHVHYEIHPRCGGPTNPTPILNAVENGNLEAYVAAVRPVFGSGLLEGSTAAPGLTAPGSTVAGSSSSVIPTTTPAAPLIGNAPGGGRAVVPTSAVVRPAASATPRAVPQGNNVPTPQPTTLAATTKPVPSTKFGDTTTSSPPTTKKGKSAPKKKK
jgi:murein DD-endopeptidase MepM/ murein hydrolase activator NlpD